jgi:hypothetical protein
MRTRNAIILLCIVCASPIFAQLTTGNTFVTAIVDPNSLGLITIRKSPGTLTSPILSFPQKSFVSIMVGDRIFTNNHTGFQISDDPRFGGFLDNGFSQKIIDTIRTTWANKNGCDIIQEVYPVDLGASGQIVIRWKIQNTTNMAIWGQAQFLLDLQVGDQNPNDGAAVLTRYGYRPVWEQYNDASTEGIPWYFITFENMMPNAPFFDPGTIATGYNKDVNYRLGLKKPSTLTVGDWGNPIGTAALVDFLWGVSNSAPWGQKYSDGAILLQWDGIGIKSGQIAEIASTAYGTSKIEFCEGTLLGALFYPQHLSGAFQPDTIVVDAYLFNEYSTPSLVEVSATLDAGPNLRIVRPDTGNIGQKSQRQEVGPTSGNIPQYGIGTASWAITVDTVDCDGITPSWLKLTGESKHFKMVFTDTCEYVVEIDCDNPPHAGIHEILTAADENFHLLGNPSFGQTHLQIELQRALPVIVRIVDVRGHLRSSRSLGMLPPGLTTIPLMTQDLPEGTYYVIAEWGDKQYARKLQIIK